MDRLTADEAEELARRRRAFDASCGVLSIGITPESMRVAEIDRLEWEAARSRGG